jgi:transcriptional regulator
MYLPAQFRVADATESVRLAREVIYAHPFATLVSLRDGEPFATHCPLTAQPAPAGLPDAPEFVLEGHLARGNPHWKDWQGEGARVLAIFHGPQAYVSPTLYAERQNVPTWNYVAVHVIGRVSTLADRDGRHDLLKRLIARIEPSYTSQWDELDERYKEKMLDAIVGFRIVPERVEAKFKVSQNRAPVDRDGVRAAFSQGSPDERSLADWMRRLGA